MDPYPAPNTEIWITPCLFPPPNAPVPSPPNIPNSFFLLPPPSIPAFSPPNIPNSVSLVPKSPTSPPAPPKVISDLFPSPPPTPFPSSTSPYTFTAGVGVGVAVASFSLLALICCGKSVKSFFARSQRTSTRTTRELPAIIELVDPSVESRNN